MSPAHTAVIELAAASDASEHRTLIISLFAAFVVATLFITVWAGRQTKSAADFYAGGRQFTGFQNGLAISGDYMSAASFLGIAGAIALFGYNGFLYSIGFLVAWLVALLLVAEPLRNSGRYTMGDVLAYRMRQRPVRTAAGTSTIVVSIFYLLAQMAGAGVLVSLLLGITSDAGKILIVALVGVLMIVYVTIGGMKGTTWVQMVKAVLLIAGTVLITFLILLKFNFNVSDLLGSAASNSGKGSAFLEPGLKYGVTATSKLDFISLGIALVLGTAGLPHILIRFYTVPTSKAARKSVNWAIGIIGAFYLMTIVLGFGAAALLKPADIIASNKAGNTAAPLAALEIGGGGDSAGGAILLAVISAVAFATILAVVAGLTLASSSSFAHDIYANVIRKGKATEKEEMKAARWATVFIGPPPPRPRRDVGQEGGLGPGRPDVPPTGPPHVGDRRLAPLAPVRGLPLRQEHDVLEHAPHAEELGEVLAVFVAREPRLAPVRGVDLGVVPRQHPDRVGAAALGGTDRLLVTHSRVQASRTRRRRAATGGAARRRSVAPTGDAERVRSMSWGTR
ncbi:Cation/acetate symporter ActP [Streptomyces alboniger]